MSAAAQIFGSFLALAIVIMIIRAVGKGRRRRTRLRHKGGSPSGDDRSNRSSRSKNNRLQVLVQRAKINQLPRVCLKENDRVHRGHAYGLTYIYVIVVIVVVGI